MPAEVWNILMRIRKFPVDMFLKPNEKLYFAKIYWRRELFKYTITLIYFAWI